MTKEELLDLMTPGGTEESLRLEEELFGRIMGYEPKMRVGKPRFRNFVGCVQCRFLGIFNSQHNMSYDLWFCDSSGIDVFARASNDAYISGTHRIHANASLKEALIRAVELGHAKLDGLVFDQDHSHITVQTLMKNLGLTVNHKRWAQTLQPQRKGPS